MSAFVSGTDDARILLNMLVGCVLASLGFGVLVAVAGWLGWGEGGFARFNAAVAFGFVGGVGGIVGGVMLLLRR